MFDGKRIVILGLARQGTALARYLTVQGARVVASDMNPRADLTSLADLPGIEFVLGSHPLTLLDGCDMLCLSGGVPIDLPIVLEARRRGVPLSNDTQIFLDACPTRNIIGITGSAGKTTTTTLVGEMLRANKCGPRVWVGGNIGNPLIADLAQIGPDDLVVLELSSFQLELTTRSPRIACITNITPNHLDRHGDMAAYIAAKKHILDFQAADDFQVLSADDPVTSGLNTAARTLWFSTRAEPQGAGAWMDEGGMLRMRLVEGAGSEEICHRRELLLMGEHNVLNVLAAALISGLAGAPLASIRAIATTFRGVQHRLQLVRDGGPQGARYYDDSIATAPERMMAALKCFDQKVILLCGGRDKHLPWEEAARMMLERCKHIVLFGEMAGLVETAIRASVEQKNVSGSTVAGATAQTAKIGEVGISSVKTLEDAVAVARAVARPGDVVLLSPGGTSYDAFKDFAERGERFKALVCE